MKSKVVIFGTRILPVWLLVVLLIATGAGAAVGTILAGKVTGEVPVAVSQALLVGQPLFNELVHTPNIAAELDEDGVVREFSVVLDDGDEFTAAKYAAIAYKDTKYASTTNAGLLPAPGDMSQQAFKFQVGFAGEITKIEVKWTGYSTSGKPNGLGIMAGNSMTAVESGNIPTTEATVTVTLDEADDIEGALNGGEYLYVNASTVPALAADETVYTNYITCTVTYSVFDWKNWASFTGPQSLEHRFHVPNRFAATHMADQTAFEAAAEVATGDWYLFALPLKNASDEDLTAIMSLNVPQGLEIEAVSCNQIDEKNAHVTNAVRIGPNTWKVIVKAGALKQDDKDYLYVIVSADAGYPPGYYMVSGTITQVPY